jgi:hypothetical protein
VAAAVLVASDAGVVASDVGVVASAAGALESVLGVVAVAGVVVGPAEVCAGASVDGAPVAADVADAAGVVAVATGAASRTECACGPPVAPAAPLWTGPAGTYEAGVWPGGIAEGDGPDCDCVGALVTADASPPTAPEDAYELECLRGEAPSV